MNRWIGRALCGVGFAAWASVVGPMFWHLTPWAEANDMRYGIVGSIADNEADPDAVSAWAALADGKLTNGEYNAVMAHQLGAWDRARKAVALARWAKN